MSKTLPLLLATTLLASLLSAAEPPAVILPPAQSSGGRPLMDVLRDRASRRDFAPEALPAQTLSNLLWAAWGINRPDTGKRTAPSAMNRQDMDLYVALPEGLYLYDARLHRLVLVVAEDLRAATGTQAYVGTAPLNLIFVSRGAADAAAGGVQAGLLSENVYLFCASEGLATVVRSSINRDTLSKAMKLAPDQQVVLAQSVGFPVKH